MAQENPTAESDHDMQPASFPAYSLEDLLPHRGNMLLIGAVLTLAKGYAETLSTVSKTWPMSGQDGVSPLILVELAAQTAGVCNGLERMENQGPESGNMGWLVAVKRADFHVDHLPFGLQITARAENTLAFDKFREVTSQLSHGDRLLAEVVLQLYQA